MTPLNDIDGGIMVGSVDGYQWIPKWLRVLYCFQFVRKKRKLCALRAYSLLSSVTAFHPWCYGFMGGENIHIPDGGSDVASFSSLSIVPLLTAQKAFKVAMRKGLPSAGWNKTFIGAVFYSLMLEATLKVKFQIYISRRSAKQSEPVQSSG